MPEAYQCFLLLAAICFAVGVWCDAPLDGLPARKDRTLGNFAHSLGLLFLTCGLLLKP